MLYSVFSRNWQFICGMVGFSLKQNVPMLLGSHASHCPLGYREQVPPRSYSFRRSVLILRAWDLFHNVYLPSTFLPFKRLLQTLLFSSWALFFVVNTFNRCYEHLTKRLFSLSQGLTQYFLSQTLLCVTVCLFSIYISSVFGSSPSRIVREMDLLYSHVDYAHACLAGLSTSACICVFLHLRDKAVVCILLGKKRCAIETFLIGLASPFISVLHTKWSLSLYWLLPATAPSC